MAAPKTTARRCVWCHGREGRLETIEVDSLGPRPWKAQVVEVGVHAEHRREAVMYFDEVSRHWRKMLFGVLGLALLPLPLAFASEFGLLSEQAVGIAVGLSLMATGALVWRFPFVTPETIRLFGVRRSLSIAKAVALLLVLLGAGLPALISIG